LDFELLSSLWLHEPNAAAIARASDELSLPPADPAELAPAYTQLFLLNVYPYGTVFTDPDGELNGAEAQRLAALYGACGYQPDAFNSVGAPDHLGLCLGFMSHLAERAADGARTEFFSSLLGWTPICCLAVERDPHAHAFYRALAEQTRRCLLSDAFYSGVRPPFSNLQPHGGASRSPVSDLQLSQSEIEISLHDIVRFFLTPAQCGVFLSRARLGQLAREMGLRLPFGSRFDVAEGLFSAAGEAERIDPLLAALQGEIEAWAAQYRRWAERHAHWRPHADRWLGRTARALRTLAEMREIAEAAAP
jgi:TorA maturation chaperone TorD